MECFLRIYSARCISTTRRRTSSSRERDEAGWGTCPSPILVSSGVPPGSITSAYNRYFTDRRNDFFRGFQLDLVSGIGNNDLAAMRGELCHPGLLFLMFFHERSCQRSLVVMLALVPRENNERYAAERMFLRLILRIHSCGNFRHIVVILGIVLGLLQCP